MRCVFEAGHGAKMLKALGGVVAGGGGGVGEGGSELSAYAEDSYRWLKRLFNEFEETPGEMERVTIRGTPIEMPRYREAIRRLLDRRSKEAAPPPALWPTAKVLGRVPQDSWPTDLSVFRGHSNWVRGVAFSPDGKFLATASQDNTARVWEVASGACVATLEGHSHRVTGVAFSPVDGKFLATASDDKTARVWEVADQK